ncbi:MAG TPA: DUF1848 domain-containing protein [Spirochaetota bacterium]|nr:DUF1848 domain-containing protein [Spirochaetota bacterium]
MILSVSRRTDIPAFYSQWFYNRIKEKYLYVRNPVNKKQVSKISLEPQIIDGFVFWTKNPEPMIDNLDLIKEYSYYFQFTLNSYGQDIEVNVPQKKGIIKTFKKLSDKIGKNKVIWRYDPIIINDKYNIDYHKKYFLYLIKELSDYTEKCIISFVDGYKKCSNTFKKYNILLADDTAINIISKEFSEIAKSFNIKLESCAELYDLAKYGINHGKCIDPLLFEQITGNVFNFKKDKNQRLECGCIESIDIGAYNTCNHECKYCYANNNKDIVLKQIELHYPYSPILIGNISEDDIITEKVNIKNDKQNDKQNDKNLFSVQ